MTIPNTPSFVRIPNTVQELLKGYRTYDKVMRKGLIDVKDTTKFVSKQVAENTKLAKELKDINDKFFKNMPGNTPQQKATVAGTNLASLLGLGLLTVAFINKSFVDNFIQNVHEKNQDRLNLDLTKTNTLATNTAIKVKNLQFQIDNLIKDLKNRIDKLNAEVGGAGKNATDARQKANDALYEVRQGRVKLDGRIDSLQNQFKQLASSASNEFQKQIQISVNNLTKGLAEAKKQANDALYETRQGRSKLESQIEALKLQFKQTGNAANTEFQKQVQNTIANISKGITEAKQQATNAQSKADKSDTKVTALEKIVYGTRETVNGLQKQVTAIPNQIIELGKALRAYVDNQLQSSQNNSVNQQLNATSAKLESLTVSTTSRLNSFEQSGRDFFDEIQRQRREIQNIKITTDTTFSAAPNRQDYNQLKQDIDKVKQDLTTTKQDLTKTKLDLDKVEKDIDEQDKMNREGLNKLNQITPLALLIPGLADKTANKVKEFTPTISDLEKAAATGTCRTTQPGGCTRKAIDDAINDINSNTNKKSNDLLDKINAGANAAQLALLQTIDNKLGVQLPGGLSGTFGRLWQTLQVDRVLSILTYIGVLHNALMLSNNIGTTLFSAIDNISQAIGFKWKNEKGEDTGFGGIVSDWTANFFKAMFGADNYNALVATWKRANRIYQAGANIINSIRSITDSIRNVAEWTAENTGRIGNAMKKFGLVGGDAFKWMPENVNAQSIWIQRLERLEDAASGIEMVTSEVLSTVENLNEIQKQTEEFKKNLEGGEPKVTKDNTKVATKESESATSSASPNISRESERKPN